MLKLTRPLAIYDLETTGTNPVTDRIVEISILKVFPDGTREVKTRKLNPERLIPKEATAIHGIADADVAEQPVFKQIAKGLYAYLSECDLCTFNGRRFDVPLLAEEFARVQLDFPGRDVAIVDVFDIYRVLNPRSLSAAVMQYLNREHALAHSAEADTTVTFELLEAMISGPLTAFVGEAQKITAEELFCPSGLCDFGDGIHHGRPRVVRVDPSGKLVRNAEGTIVWNFGKHAGRPVTNTETGFIEWLLKNDFPETTKTTVRKVVEGAVI
ncbi:MAG TPA: 3'-5' exonuclease [Hymenobacter sp.]|jgi:DNA polymerase-3 subunit epsilon|uniref:3'-5' exonuclease n=1 Tax=Hymenobacter sp. TaxID=1898978 RepID=UPI002ED97AFF